MAKLYSQKSRKEYVCSKCGNKISVGEMYYKIEAMNRPTIIRCSHCRPERSELTGSEYYSWLYNLQDHIDELFDLNSEDAKDDVISELESQRDELQDKLDNMPEQLQYAPTGELLQERIDSIQDALDTLDNIDFPDVEQYEDDENKDDLFNEAVEDYAQEIRDAISDIQ